MSSPTHDTSRTTSTPMALIVVAWALVVIPLLYGLVQTIRTASALFTG